MSYYLILTLKAPTELYQYLFFKSVMAPVILEFVPYKLLILSLK